MNPIGALRESEFEDRVDAVLWVVWALVGMMPLWSLILVLKILAQEISLEVLAGNGELALYSAAVLSGALYVVLKEVKPSSLFHSGTIARQRGRLGGLRLSFPGYGVLVCVLSLLVLFSAVAYTTVTVAHMVPGPLPGPEVNQGFLLSFTVAVLCLALGLGYLVTVIDTWFLRERDLIALQQEQYDGFEERFERVKSEE